MIASRSWAFMHSESRAIHEVAELLFRERVLGERYDFERRHEAIVDRFGRYPHHNELLGRPYTPAELAFLTQPGCRFQVGSRQSCTRHVWAAQCQT